MAKTYSIDFTNGSLVKKFILFALPLLASELLQQLYSMADMVVVGQFAGDNALAAVGASGAIITLLLNLFIGLALGANIICSNLIGARDKQGLQRSMHTSILVSLVCGVALCIIGLFLSRPLLILTNCPASILDQAVLYMQIYFCGTPVSMLYNFGAAILRAHGDTRRPMVILMVSGLVNVILNLLLVIVFRMGVAGVAVATVASQLVSAVAVLYILFNPKEEYGLKVRDLRIHIPELKKLISIGVPCGLNGIVFSIANVLLQTSVNSLGEVAAAAAAASTKITALVFTFPASAYSACVSFAGQCYGAKNYKRIDELLGKGIAISAGIISVVSLLLTVFSAPSLRMFSDNPEVISAAQPMLIIFVWSYVLYSVPQCTMGCVRGMGKSTGPTLINAFCICVPRLLWNYLLFPLYPTIGWLYVCFPISYVICSVGQLMYYAHCRRKLVPTQIISKT